MSIVEKIRKLRRNPSVVSAHLAKQLSLIPVISDATAQRIQFRAALGYALDLDNPTTFNEKLQWLKINDRNSLYTILVDKYAVKKWVAERIGSEYVIPTYGIWESFDDIDFNLLPEQFVLKCTHDSGGLVICRNRVDFEMHSARRIINNSLRKNFYWSSREWPYMNVPPRVIAEMYLDANSNAGNVGNNNGSREVIYRDATKSSGMTDYKFYCFNGCPKLLYISRGLENHSTACISFLTLEWEFAPFGRTDYNAFTELPPKPTCFEEMISIAKELSKGMPFVRVDLYAYRGKPLFSEMTFTPCGGLMRFEPQHWDARIGNWLELPQGRGII